ncbi:MAG: beta-propeller fold lactonase family protein [Pseudomonadota bacterium]
MRFDRTKFMRGLLLLAAVSLASCGGGGGSTPPPGGGTPATYSISVNVSGLISGTFDLYNRNYAETLNIASDGTYTFSTPVTNSLGYDVSVSSPQPTGQFCTVIDGTGNPTAPVTLTVSCAPAYTIGGTAAGPGGVSGLNGTGLVLLLKNNGTVVENLPISGTGSVPFTFNTKLASGNYAVSVLSRPRKPAQDCPVTGGSNGDGTGPVGADVFNVVVTCTNSVSLLDSPRYAYVANSNDHTVSGYIVDALTGQLRPNGYVYVGATTGPSAVAVDPSGQFAYVANSLGDSVSAYAIGSDGRLTLVAAAIPAGDGPSSVTVDPSGRYVYVTNAIGENITAYSINLGTGALTRIPCIGGVTLGCSGNNPLNYLTGANPTSISVAPAGQYAYVTNSSGVSGYSIDGYGALTAIDTSTAIGAQASILAGTNPNSVSIDPSGAYAYVANGGGNVSSYTIASSGELASVGSIAAGVTPRSVVVDPYGLSVYVANYGTDTISGYNIGGTGALSATTPASAAAGDGPSSVAVDPSGKFAYVANNLSADVSVFDISAGPPAAVSGTAANTRSRAGSASIAMTKGATAVTYTPKFAYVANSGSDSVSGYTITAGVLAQIVCGSPATCSGNDFSAGTSPAFVAVDPYGRFAYAANSGNTNNISVYEIAFDTGQLSANAPAQAGNGPGAIAVDPSGRFAYVTNGDGTVWGYGIDQAVGELTQIDMDSATAGTQSITAPGSNLRSVAIDPTGRFAYVVHDNGVSAYLIAASSGTLSLVGTVGAGTTPSSAIVDPTGRFAYVANSGTNTVSAYAINASTGELSELGTSPYALAASAAPKSVAVDPTGQYAYVANNGTGSVSAYAINASTGELSELLGSPYFLAASAGPKSVTVDISGAYLYVANNNGTVSTFTIGADGALSGGATIAAGTSPASVATAGTIQ